MRRALVLPLTALLGACTQPAPPPPAFDTAVVERRDIVVEVEAAGTVEPTAAVELKSKASGEILAMNADIGDTVAEGALLVRIDPRTPRNRLSQAKAELEAARSRAAIARTQKERAAKLLPDGTITQVDYEQSALEYATATAQVVTAEVNVENARIALEDTEIRAPISGTIIQSHVEKGQVISSPTQDVGGGTLLLVMADLTNVQVRVLVDETDIGKIEPGLPATVTVAAFPNQPFIGRVLKIEPQAVVDQNVTMFAVLVSIDNRQGLLKPGMNADVSVVVARRDGVLAVPVAAIRTMRDLDATARILGTASETLRSELGAAPAVQGAPQMPPGITAGARPGAGAAGPVRSGASSGYRYGGRFWVVVAGDRGPRAVPVKTGVTDLDYAEIDSGLSGGERVLLLPSAHLVETQAQLQSFIDRRLGSVPGVKPRQ